MAAQIPTSRVTHRLAAKLVSTTRREGCKNALLADLYYPPPSISIGIINQTINYQIIRFTDYQKRNNENNFRVHDGDIIRLLYLPFNCIAECNVDCSRARNLTDMLTWLVHCGDASYALWVLKVMPDLQSYKFCTLGSLSVSPRICS